MHADIEVAQGYSRVDSFAYRVTDGDQTAGATLEVTLTKDDPATLSRSSNLSNGHDVRTVQVSGDEMAVGASGYTYQGLFARLGMTLMAANPGS